MGKEQPNRDACFLQLDSISFNRLDVIGHGASSCVFKGTLAGELVAVKEVHGSSTLAHVEVDLLARLHHPHVLRFFGCAVSDVGLVYIVTELMDFSLAAHLAKYAPLRMPRFTALRLALHVARGLQYLHQNRIVHRDLKPGNVLLVSNRQSMGGLMAKISDFGVSRSVQNDLSSMTAVVGTIEYMAPEILMGESDTRIEYGPPVDVFSMGILLWQIVTCHQPYKAYEELNRFTLLHRIAKEGLRPEIPSWMHDPLAALIKESWSKAEEGRPTAVELVRRLQAIESEPLSATSAVHGDSSTNLDCNQTAMVVVSDSRSSLQVIEEKHPADNETAIS